MEDKELKKKNEADKPEKSLKKDKKLSVASEKTVSKNAPSKFNFEETKEKFRIWFKGIQAELKKIIWPTKDQLIAYTVVVLVTLVTTAIFLYVLGHACSWIFGPSILGIA